MPEITRRGLLTMQVCIPKEYTEQQIIDFAEEDNPAGTTNGWSVLEDGNELLGGDAARVQCEETVNHCHVIVSV